MAREPAGRSVEQLLRAVERKERARGLLSMSKPRAAGLLGAADFQTAMPAAAVAEPAPMPQGGPGVETNQPMQSGGLLAAPRRGLLAPMGGPAQGAPAAMPARPESSLLGKVGNFADDFLFGGAAGDLRAERRARDDKAAADAAHRDAYAYAMTPTGFDPNRYGSRMGELGQAPDMGSIVNLEGVNDGRDARGLRQRTERRGVVGGALAPVMGMPEDQRGPALAAASGYLQGEGYAIDPTMGPDAIRATVGGAMGPDSVLANQRGDQALAEQVRSAQAGERYREQDLGFRQDESQWERGFRQQRAAADDSYRASELNYRREAMTVPNSPGDVLAPILSKVATMGVEALTDGERAIWERYQQSGQNPFGGLIPGMGATPSPAAPAAPRQAGPDPFPGIAEGRVIEQDGVRYQRRGNQMVPIS